MKFLVKVLTIGLAAIGARDLYRRIKPRFDSARSTATSVAENTVQPAVCEPVRSVKASSRHAVHEMVDASCDAVSTIRDGDAAAGAPNGTRPNKVGWAQHKVGVWAQPVVSQQ